MKGDFMMRFPAQPEPPRLKHTEFSTDVESYPGATPVDGPEVQDEEQDGSRYDDYSGVDEFTEDDDEYCQELLEQDALDDYNAECT